MEFFIGIMSIRVSVIHHFDTRELYVGNGCIFLYRYCLYLIEI